MNKIRPVLTLVALLILLRLDAPADLVSFPQGDAKWTVEVTLTGSSSGDSAAPTAKPPPVQVTEAVVTQLNNVKKIALTWSDGKNTEKWTLPNLPAVFEEDPRNGFVTPFLTNDRRAATNNFFLTYDRFAFDWLTPQTLQEKDPISYGGKQCYHYLGSAPLPFSKTVILVKREAWIDATTQQPVAFDNGSSISTYQFDPKPPTGPLVMPPAFKRAIDYYKVALGYP